MRTAVLSLLLATQWLSVLGHGFVHSLGIDGQDYSGWNPFSDPYVQPIPERVVRKIQSDGPVESSDTNLACNIDGDSGTQLVADVSAGSSVTFWWDYWPADHQGPVSTYMTSCNGDCSDFSATGTKWFKLDASGYFPDERMWAADKLRADNNSWTSVIPRELAVGQYLIRNEIIALHSQTPQFYPMCGQINVQGGGSGVPGDADLVSIPGLYDGVVFPNIYSDFGTFNVPGPAPVTFGAGGDASTTDAGSSPSRPSSAGSRPSVSSTSRPVTSKQICQLSSWGSRQKDSTIL